MSLREYRRKRDFAKTPEPDGSASAAPRRTYAMQKHAARRLHYDLRLELDGVLLSWAVPKGPSLDPKEKRLAVRTEDHPLDYAGFEGVIPEGEYGAGTVMLWDRGEWEPITDPHEADAEGMYKIRLFGRKLRGAWALVQLKGKDSDGGKNWLMIKERDGEVRAEDDYCVIDQQPFSVATNRTMGEIAAARDRIWSSSTGLVSGRQGRWTRREQSLRAEQLFDPGRPAGARQATQPSTFRPAGHVANEQVPDGDDWLHEIAVDGQRMIATVRPDEVRLLTDEGEDWTDELPELARALARLPIDQAILDGTIAVFDPRGVSRAAALDAALAARRSAAIRYELNDIPHCRGLDLRAVPLTERKQILQRLLADGDGGDLLRFGDHIGGHGSQVYENACRLGVAALLSRKAQAKYAARGAAVTTPCRTIVPLVLCGVRTSGATTTVALGFHADGELAAAGTAVVPDELRDELAEHLGDPTDDCPCAPRPRGRDWKWYHPELVVEVAAASWDADLGLEAAEVHALTDDDPDEVRHAPASRDEQDQQAVTAAERAASAQAGPLELHGVRFTNPDRMLYPEDRVTKRVLAAYYESIAEQILPHIARRPLSLFRCPNGYENDSFFQKHLGEMQTPHLRESPVRKEEGKDPYIALDDISGLLTLAQLSVLEIHPWGSREGNVDKPDRMIFDLDPGPNVPWRQVVDAARALRDVLADLGLTGFVKTSGGKGLHIVVPLQRRVGWTELKAASMAIARQVAEDEPRQFVITMAKWAREGRVFIDYLRNVRGATCVSAYSTRARAGAAVSTPLFWEELDANPVVYTVHSLPRRLASLRGDPWEGFFTVRQSLTRRILDRLNVRRAG